MSAARRNNEPRYRPVRGIPYEEMTEAERDYGLEDRLIFLVAQLEQLMTRLLEQDTRPAAVMPQLLAEMVNRAVMVAEKLPSVDLQKIALLRAIEEAGHIYPLVRLLPVKNNRFVIEMITGGGQGQIEYLSSSPSSMHQLCQGMMLVLRRYFTLFGNFFYFSAMQERWKGLYQVFISDLAYAVAEIQPLNSVRRGNEVRR